MAGELSPSLRDWLALTLVPGLGPRLTAALLAHFGSPAAVCSATAEQLQQVPQIGAKLARQFTEALRRADVVREWEAMQRHGVTALVDGEADYPSGLTTIPDPPVILYQRGQLQACDTQAIGIVGSRSATTYGLRMAARLAHGLARAGWTVVSGLARGIDGAAHRAALEAGGRTIAVLAGGLARIYPPEHTLLADEIAAQGALLSETPMQQAPQAGMFPARNRIISGLSRGIVVVEAGAKSGALITATHAGEQGREVFAVPGPADSAASEGTHALIRKGARLVRSAADILEDLTGIAPIVSAAPRSVRRTPETAAAPSAPSLFPEAPPGLDETQRRLWNSLTQAKHTDELARELGLSVPALMTQLMLLEMKKAIRKLPGNRYERT